MLPPSGLLSVLAVCLLTRVVQGENQGCVDIPTENNIKMEDVEGTWHPMEIVLHRNDSKIYGVPLDTKCPVVTFSPAPKNKKILLMVWNATEGDIEYRFQLKGPKAGQWQATGDQAGSLVNDQYKNYGGIVRVLRLDTDFMFLSYCSNKSRLLNTVAFSRNNKMPKEVFNDVLDVLDDRHYKRAREISVTCEEDQKGSGHRAWVLCLLIMLSTLVVVVNLGH